MKDLIVRIIGENRVRAGLDAAKNDIQRFSESGKTLVKSLKDELTSFANNTPILGSVTRGLGATFTAAIAAAVMFGKAFKNAIEDSAAAWKDFGDRIDSDFVRFSKQALEFNKNFRKSRESGNVETAIELRVNTEKAREDLLAEIRKLQGEIDAPGLFARVGRTINRIGGRDEAGGLAGTRYQANVMELRAKQNDLARLDREIMLAKKLELDNAVKAASQASGSAIKSAAEFEKTRQANKDAFARATQDVLDANILKSGTDPEKESVAARMLDEGLAKLGALKNVAFPTDADVQARRAATEQVLQASDILDGLKKKADEREKAPIEDPAFAAAAAERAVAAQAAMDKLRARVREERIGSMSPDDQVRVRQAEAARLKDELFFADPLRKAEIGNRLLDLREEIKSLVGDKAATAAVAAEAAKESSRATFQSINAGDAFESLYGQRSVRDPAERTAVATEKSLEVLREIHKKTGAAP